MESLTTQRKVLIGIIAVWCFSPIVTLFGGSGLGDFWYLWGVCGSLALALTIFSIYREIKFAAMTDKELAMRETWWYQIRGLLLFIVSLILTVEIIKLIFFFPRSLSVEGLAVTTYHPIFLPDGIFTFGTGKRNIGISRILLTWLFTTLWVGSSIAFYYENRLSRMIITAKNDFLFATDGHASYGASNQNESEFFNPPSITRLLKKHQNNKPAKLNRPATYNDIISAMELQLQQAMEVAELLQEELSVTRSRVVDLEVEVKQREEEIIQIQEYKLEMNKFVAERGKESNDNQKTLSLTDSVMVGDSIMGGVKIDKQINNDPEAIAKAVIEAYRTGLAE